jgi:branched-subunit amino acid transport protein
VTPAWALVALLGVVTVALKGAGPLLLGDRELPARPRAMLALLAPGVLAGLVVTQTVGGDGGVIVDARLLGVGAAAVALALRAPLLVVLVVAAGVAAAARALGLAG